MNKSYIWAIYSLQLGSVQMHHYLNFSSLPSYIPWSFYSFEVPPIHYWLSSLFWQSKSARTNYFSCYKSHSISLPPSVARSGSLYLVTKTSFWWLREAERANWSCVFCTYVSLVVQVENGNSQKEKKYYQLVSASCNSIGNGSNSI